jgi:starvation-inducible DNA-binding protein
MEKLIEQMKKVLASNFALYLKTHNFHWNVEGPNFPQYHEFLNNIYEEIWLAGDKIAEEIRTLGAYAPGSFIRFSSLSVIEDQINVPTAINMLRELAVDNKKMIDELRKAHKLAEENEAFGLANFLQDRIDIHSKHLWMLTSTTKVSQ